ncbi:hypothetical protein FB45DRAFT_742071 [Roridomyces roridus]|uniref:F-box domain-containing protein n=1 Tax=Roridomyces roridus TaxID=1738132 RepID=A0AAD7C1T7_9AGAR|nr:hypothetical protein FB45DRAFT_742071 [Roridomyces roridus]
MVVLRHNIGEIRCAALPPIPICLHHQADKLFRDSSLRTISMLSLPPEILLEITDYFHNTPIPFERYRQDPTPILLGRFETLRSLSQTCSYLRYVFRPLVWEAMEVLDTPSDVTGRHINLLKRWMTGILKTPDLLPCVRLSSPNWNFISLFTRFLHSTPNLAALHIIEIFDRHAGPLAVRLAKRPFPAVQTLTIPSSLSRVLCSFPNLRTLVCADTFISDYDAGNLLKQAHKHCHELDSLSNFTPSNSIIQGFLVVCTRTFFYLLRSQASSTISRLSRA